MTCTGGFVDTVKTGTGNKPFCAGAYWSIARVPIRVRVSRTCTVPFIVPQTSKHQDIGIVPYLGNAVR